MKQTKCRSAWSSCRARDAEKWRVRLWNSRLAADARRFSIAINLVRRITGRLTRRFVGKNVDAKADVKFLGSRMRTYLLQSTSTHLSTALMRNTLLKRFRWKRVFKKAPVWCSLQLS